MRRLWIIYFAVLIICLVYSRSGQAEKKKCVTIVTIIMTLGSGLRTWWYGDLVKYYTRFLTESSLSLREVLATSGLRNIGLTLLNKFAYSLFGEYGYDVLLFCIALFSAYTLGMVIVAYSPSAYWSYLMYFSMGFYVFTLSGLKQTIAMGFCCMAMIALLRDNFKQFMILVIIGALFHAPALIFAIAYPLSRKKYDIWYVIFVAALMAAMYFYRNQLAYYLEDIYHSEQAAEAVLATESSGVGGRFIGMLMILMLAMWLRPLTTKDTVYSKVFSIMVLAAIIQLMAIFSNTYTRLADYFYQFIVLFVPMFLRPITKKNELLYRRGNALLQNNEFRLALSVGITVFSIWFYYWQLSGIQSNTIMLFFWEKNAHLLY